MSLYLWVYPDVLLMPPYLAGTEKLKPLFKMYQIFINSNVLLRDVCLGKIGNEMSHELTDQEQRSSMRDRSDGFLSEEQLIMAAITF